MSTEIYFYTILLYLFFYLGNLHKRIDHKFFYIILFWISSFILRFYIRIDLNKDYYIYVYYYNIKVPDNWIGYITKEPYLYLLYQFFSYFNNDKIAIFEMIYYFNFIIVNIFFTWLILIRDVQPWKKNVFFSLYYMLFGYVLLRNGIPYIILAYFIYQIYRGGTTKWVYVTPFIHISSAALLVLKFHKSKNYFKYFILISTVLFFIIIVSSTILNRPELELLKGKIDIYSELGQDNFGIFHYIYLMGMMIMCLIAYFYTKKRFLNPIIITTMVLYLFGFFINPVVGFRFSPYLVMALVFFGVNIDKYQRINRILNYSSIVLLGYFIYSVRDTHFLD